MEKNKKISLVMDIDYYNKNVRSKISWDKDGFVSYTENMSELEKKGLKKMITTELKPITDYLNPVKIKKPKLDQGTRSESAKDELIKVLKAENTQLKARVGELEAEIVELKAENAQLKTQIVELMAMNKTLLARLDAQNK